MSPRSEEQFEAMRQKSKQAILDGALKLFAQQGYARTSIEDIAERVGVSKGLVYNYFASKEAIMSSLIDDFASLMIPGAKAPESKREAVEVLRGFVRNWFTLIRSNPELVRLGTHFHTDIALQKLFKKKQAEYDKTLTPFFISLFTVLGSPNPVADTFLLGSIADGVGLNYSTDPSSLPLDKIEERVIELFASEKEEQR